MLLNSIHELFLQVMQGIVTLIPPVISDSVNEVVRIVRITLRWYWNFAINSFVFELLLEELPGIPVQVEDRNFQAPEKMWLVRNRKKMLVYFEVG